VRYRRLRRRIAASETAKAAGLAIAALTANAVAVVVTVVFTRLLGDDDYGSLAALLSAFTILAVAGSSLQVAVARDTARGRLGDAAGAIAALRGWTRTLLVVVAGVALASILLRDQIGDLVGVREEPWAVAAVAPTGVLWLLLSLQRGVLQGLGAYTPVGASVVVEALCRLVAGCVLVLLGAGVAGAYLGTPLAMAGTSVALAEVLHRRAARGTGEAPHTHRRLRSLVEITRPFSLTASIVPVAAAGALALVDGLMNWTLFALALVAGVLLQVGTNVINEVYDVRKGVDSITSPRASQALVTGRVRERDAFVLAYSALALCALLGLAMVVERGWPLLLIGAFGLVMGWGYTAPPLQYKYRALGLPLVFLLMGPLMVLGGYYASTGRWSWDAAAASVPIGLLVTAILHGNEWRDIGEDARAGIRTISISAGRAAAHWIYVVLLVGAYVSLALGVAFGLLPRLSLLAVLSMPLLVQALRASELGATGQQREIAMIDRNTARLHATFGALFVLGLAAASA